MSPTVGNCEDNLQLWSATCTDTKTYSTILDWFSFANSWITFGSQNKWKFYKILPEISLDPFFLYPVDDLSENRMKSLRLQSISHETLVKTDDFNISGRAEKRTCRGTIVTLSPSTRFRRKLENAGKTNHLRLWRDTVSGASMFVRWGTPSHVSSNNESAGNRKRD